ncbi:hypothetical protein GCM10008107_23230 [Psychrosphaera saromensis]|uniref:DUF3325 domain-containing protein n=1 Tax=Psychrosphaera saromensis TaxID=716813 RepID=A0A2S7UR02_9GAMM|nr:DUF3325 family protein [Psychrosphaera saromensis]PQJ52363.1 hypothetical protein BTO11_00980 [Psychrosphaera saromensis]GHB73154.1 hypothetical protein GCM10008107_23230 [Psychrosphaera saromensis]GLQ13474.1 hypothetical protein GCM10007917_09290 [Psychrosphaera saromensis]
MLISIVLQMFALPCLLLSMDKHFKVVFNTRLTKKARYTFKTIGWSGIAISTLLMLQLSGVEIVYWLAYLSFNIALLIGLYTWLFAGKTSSR